jgi:hypothetical protein
MTIGLTGRAASKVGWDLGNKGGFTWLLLWVY